MKHTVLSLSLLLLLLTSGCGSAAPAATEPDRLSIVATTYPVFLLTQMVTDGVDGISLHPLINQPISCPHDYSLTVNDMMAVETADVLIQNGAGLEPFLSDILDAYPSLPVIDSSAGVSLLKYQGHDATEENDPHIWLDPSRAAQMVENIGAELSKQDPDHTDAYLQNAEKAAGQLREYGQSLAAEMANLPNRELITFHDGFGYLADACDLTILKSIEEEAGSEASAQDIAEIAALVKSKNIPAVFCEANGSDSAAQTISRETGATVATLSLMMSGSEERTTPNAYYTIMDQNADSLRAALQ